MGTAFWIRRFFTVLILAGAVITLAQWTKGHPLQYALDVPPLFSSTVI